MNNYEKRIYGFPLHYGILYVYGDNMIFCSPYIDDIVDCVEDICSYAQTHKLLVYYEPYKSFNLVGIAWEIYKVSKLSRKYSVYSSQSDFYKYAESVLT